MNLKNTEVGRWKPGQSGNPSGKPKGTKHRATLIKKWLDVEQEFENPITGELVKITQEEIMILAQIKKARSGDSKSFELLLEMGYIKEETEHSGSVATVILPKPVSEDLNEND